MLNSQDILDMLNQGYSEAEVAEAVTASLNEAISTKRETDRLKAEAEAKKVEAEKIATKNEQREAIRHIYHTLKDYVETYAPDARDALDLNKELSDKECDEFIKSFESCLGIFTFLNKLYEPEDKAKKIFNDDSIKNVFDRFIDKFNDIF